MWTKNWHRLMQAAYSGFLQQPSGSLPYYDDEGIGVSPRVKAYDSYLRAWKWVDIPTNPASGYSYCPFPAPLTLFSANSQLALSPELISYYGSNFEGSSSYISRNNVIQIGNGAVSDAYTAYNLGNPVDGFTISNILTQSSYDDTTKKHTKAIDVFLTNNTPNDITISEFGLWMHIGSMNEMAQYFRPALVFYENFPSKVVHGGDVIRFTITQEIPTLEVSTQ